MMCGMYNTTNSLTLPKYTYDVQDWIGDTLFVFFSARISKLFWEANRNPEKETIKRKKYIFSSSTVFANTRWSCSFFLHVAISSTSELKTKLGNVVVISLHRFTSKLRKLISHFFLIYQFFFVLLPQCVKKYLRYGSVMILSNDGFLFTKSLHSSLSIFPSWLTSASSNVCFIYENKETYHVITSTQIYVY